MAVSVGRKCNRIKLAIQEAESAFVYRSDDLADIPRRSRIAINEATVQRWLRGVTHNLEAVYEDNRILAGAWDDAQRIDYNREFIKNGTYTGLLETVKHELGHLFCWHFYRRRGHCLAWRQIGEVIGYEPNPVIDRKRLLK